MKMLTVSALVCAMMLLTGAAETHLVKRSALCSTGWHQINGRLFCFVPRARSWAEAEKNCQALGGNLASIHSLEEYQEVQRLTDVETWVGGSDAQEEGRWFWSDGSRFDYRNWCSGEPNNDNGRQHCVQMNYGVEKCWDDCQCSLKRPSVCAKEN